MRQIPALVTAAAVLSLATPVTAQTTVHHPACAGYAMPRVLAEGQVWWMDHSVDLTQTTHNGHLHVEACIPHARRVSGAFPLDVTVKLHDNPGEVWSVTAFLVHAAGKTDIADRIDLSFRCSVPGDCTQTYHLSANTALAPVDGGMRLRVRALADTPGTPGKNNMSAVAQSMVNIQNGNPERSIPEVGVQGSGSYTEAGYANCSMAISDSRNLDEAHSGVWAPHLSHASTGPDDDPGWNITRSFVSVDPNLHAGNIGRVIRDDGGSDVESFEVGEQSVDGAVGEVSIDTTTLTNGWHKLLCLSQARTTSVLGPFSITGVGVWGFYVAN
jgi:hypothetical protein